MSASQFREPLLPTVGADQNEQRSLAGLGELVRALLRSGAFLTRPSLANIIIPRSGEQTSLRWGSLNRVLCRAASTAQLPRITPARVGETLELVLLDSSFTLTITPSGLGSDGKAAPRINGGASYACSSTGLYLFKTDGQNWFTNAGP